MSLLPEAKLDSAVAYPSVVVALIPEDWQGVPDNKLTLPTGWNLQEAQDL